MNRHLGLIGILGLVALMIGLDGSAAFPQDSGALDVLKQSSTLLKEQQALDARLGNSNARLEELKMEQQRVNEQTERLKADRETNQSMCGGASYYIQRAECDQQITAIANSNENLSRQQRDISQRRQSTAAEVEALKMRQEKLKQQTAAMDEKLKRLELSGTAAQECLARLPRNDFSSKVRAYEQCWDGTSAAQPALRSEEPIAPSMEKPGPIEQMGIEDEKRRKRRAKQAEARGEAPPSTGSDRYRPF
jgi:predicted nuclease with TOPRIM domain